MGFFSERAEKAAITSSPWMILPEESRRLVSRSKEYERRGMRCWLGREIAYCSRVSPSDHVASRLFCHRRKTPCREGQQGAAVNIAARDWRVRLREHPADG